MKNERILTKSLIISGLFIVLCASSVSVTVQAKEKVSNHVKYLKMMRELRINPFSGKEIYVDDPNMPMELQAFPDKLKEIMYEGSDSSVYDRISNQKKKRRTPKSSNE